MTIPLKVVDSDWEAELPPDEPPPEWPIIVVAAGRPDFLATDAEQAILDSGLPIYQRGRELVRPAQFEVPAAKGRMTLSAGLATLSAPGMMETLSRAADWVKYDGRRKKNVPCDPPSLPGAILLARVGQWRLLTISGVITAPTLRPDGSMLHAPGYDVATRLYHVPDPHLTPEYVPERPTIEQAREALALFLDLLDEFPFVATVDRAVALSGLLTPVLRGAIPVAPLHAIKASTAGTGKSYLVDLASGIAAGRACPVISVSVDAKETESRINGLLLGGFPLASLDNVNGELGNDILAQAVTQPTVQVRRLGASEIFEVESRATWFATGNGLRVRGDMTRRTIVCTLDAGTERPEMRQFAHRPLDDIFANRGKYLAAALTIARAYITSGKPGRLPAPASFEDWSDLVRSPLVWLGCDDPWTTTQAAREDDPELTLLRNALAGWSEAVGINNELPGRRVIEIANAKSVGYVDQAPELLWPDFRDCLLQIAGNKGAIDPTRLGKWLLGREGRIAEGMRFKRGKPDTHAKAATWKVETA
jgi:putative DNA primase/helicase